LSIQKATEKLPTRQTITDIDTLRALLPTWMGKKFAFDVETSGLKWRTDRLLGLALYFEDGRTYYVCLAHTIPLWTDGHVVQSFIHPHEFATTIYPLFAQQDVLMIAHNAKFDMHFLHRQKVWVQGRLADTLLAAQLLDENRENDLKSLASSLLGFSYDKYQHMNVYKGYKNEEILGAPLEKVADYAMNDVEATWKLYKLFSKQLANEEWRGKTLEDVYLNAWMPLLIVLQQMEARGIALNIDLVKTMREQYQATADKHYRSFHKQAARLVLDKYGADIPSMFIRTATADELEEAFEGEDGHRYVARDGVDLPIITHEMVGRNKTWRPRILHINTGSPKQMNHIVYELCDIKVPDYVRLSENPAKTALSVNKDNLQTIVFYMGNDTPELIRDLLTWRKAAKFVSTYLDRFIEDGDPEDFYAMHTWFAMAIDDDGEGGTATGRLSSKAPNLQNIPSRGEVGKQARSMFIPREGFDLLVADLGQAELRMLAHYSMDEQLILAFEENRDLHILTGAGFARMDYEELKEWYDDENHPKHDKAKELRQLGKTGNFALTYGMGPFKFQRRLLIDNNFEVEVAQAKEWIDGYNEKYKGAYEWKHGKEGDYGQRVGGVINYARRHGFVVTFGGRKRRLPNINARDRKVSSYAERQAINAIIQGSVGDVICEAMIPIQKALMGLGGSLLLQVHDELVAEVPKENSLLAKTIMEDMMVRECNKYLRVPQVADCHIGPSWGAAKG
jgi:DNA polymerase-1